MMLYGLIHMCDVVLIHAFLHLNNRDLILPFFSSSIRRPYIKVAGMFRTLSLSLPPSLSIHGQSLFIKTTLVQHTHNLILRISTYLFVVLNVI